MHRFSLRTVVFRLLVFTLAVSGVLIPAEGQAPAPTAGQAAGVFAILGGAIGVGAYFIARAPRTTGCVLREGGSLALQGSGRGDPVYLLEGNTASLHEGERVKVVGRRRERTDHRSLIRVKDVSKRYGTCSTAATVPTPSSLFGATESPKSEGPLPN